MITMTATTATTPAYPGDLIEHLRAFATLATILDRGPSAFSAFSRAARELAIDQSVLRRRLAMLEEFVGEALLAGRGARLKLTRSGAQIRTHASSMLDLTRTIAAAGASSVEDDEGPLRVSCTGTILAEVLPSVLAKMRARHPKLRFRVRREGDESSRRLIAKDEIDFAIVRSTFDLAAHGAKEKPALHARKLADDRLWLAAPARNTLARKQRVSIADIAKEALIGYPPTSATMKRLMTVLAPLGASPWIEVDRKAAALAYVAANLGVAFVSLVANQTPKHRNVVVRDVTAFFPKMAFWLVWSSSSPPPSPNGWRKDFVDAIVSATKR